MKKYLILSILAIFGILYFLSAKKTTQPEIIPTPKEIIKPVTLTLVGDIMMDRGVEASLNKNFNGDFNALFVNTSYLKESDITFGNLEGPAANSGYKIGSRFSFRMNPDSLVAMRDAGFDIVSFANNHVGDFTKAAFLETIENLNKNNILVTGAGQNYNEVITPTVIDVRGLKVGFLATTDVGPDWLAAKENTSGILLSSDPKLPEIIMNAKKLVDVLVVSYHFGNEYSPVNTRQQKLAYAAIDSGADIVVGHHPHVMEKVEIYKEKIIFYSLGNYIFDQYFSPHTMRGMVAHVSIDPKTRQLTTTQEISSQSREFIPQALIPFDPTLLITKTFTP